MDIDILIFLQNFRNGSGAILADLMQKSTFFGELNTTMALLAITYWCIDKALGTYLLMGWSGNRFLNGTLKVTFCAYRPWIRDPRIVPYSDSMKTATGYSFPSGHSMNASTVFGGGVVRRDLPFVLRITLFLIMSLVGFSRLYLGVHTPQDVLVAFIAGMFVMSLTILLLRWVEAHPEKDWIVVVTGLVIALLLGLYAGFKPYPIDYDAEGNILVEGAKMANDTFKAIGWASAFLIGWFLERRYVKFSTDISLPKRFARCFTGMIGFYIVSLVNVPLVKMWFSSPFGTMLSCFEQMFYISFLFPWLFMKLEKPDE